MRFVPSTRFLLATLMAIALGNVRLGRLGCGRLFLWRRFGHFRLRSLGDLVWGGRCGLGLGDRFGRVVEASVGVGFVTADLLEGCVVLKLEAVDVILAELGDLQVAIS